MKNKKKAIALMILFAVFFLFLGWRLSSGAGASAGDADGIGSIVKEERNAGNEVLKVYADKEFARLIAENPIDQYFTLDQEETVVGADGVNNTSRYRQIWEREIENALEILKGYLSIQDYGILEQAYKNQMAYIDRMFQVEDHLFEFSSIYTNVDGESVYDQESHSKMYEVEAERTRSYAIELMYLEYVFTGTVKFHKETSRLGAWSRADGLLGSWAQIEAESDYCFPKPLFDELVTSLKEGWPEEKLQELSAEYRVLKEEEKRALVRAAEGYSGVSELCAEDPMYLEDDWYIADLSENGNDLVIDSFDLQGDPCIYYFANDLGKQVYTEPPVFMGQNWKERLYFIKWEGVSYMAIPVRDKGSGEIVGIEVYDGSEDTYPKVTGIWINNMGEGEMRSQEYVTTSYQHPPEGAERWPTVLPGSKKDE